MHYILQAVYLLLRLTLNLFRGGLLLFGVSLFLLSSSRSSLVTSLFSFSCCLGLPLVPTMQEESKELVPMLYTYSLTCPRDHLS